MLVLLPTHNNKLLMQWKGPYNVIGRIGMNDYRVHVKGKVRAYHVNLLKEYVERKYAIFDFKIEAYLTKSRPP